MEGFIDPIVINRLNVAIQNATTLRRESMVSSLDRRRSIADECGFPDSSILNPHDMRELYDRDALAARVVEIWPRECWKVYPDVYETEDNTVNTPFEIAWKNLGQSLVSEPGYNKQDKSNGIFDYLMRADIQCGIGRYGGILLGLSDISTTVSFSDPVSIKSVERDSVGSQVANAGSLKLNFIRVFDESQCQIIAREVNQSSPRFGHPTQYQITFDSADEITGIGMGNTTTVQNVHWTRVVHVVDNIQSNEIVGHYRIRPVLNDILTAQKPRWGSGEVYWKNAQQKLSFETHPQLGGDVMINRTKMQSEIEKAMNGLQQWWVLTGMSAKPIAPTSIDPKPYVDISIQSICVKIEVPVPVFIGYEVGELAGSMNVEDWNSKVMGRRQGHCTSRIIEPFINRLINIGVLPIPAQGYIVKWPNIVSQSPLEKAQIAQIKINSLGDYLAKGLESKIPFKDIVTRFLDMTDEEAQSIMTSAEEQARMKPVTESPLTKMVGGITGAVSMFDALGKGVIQPDQLKQLLMLFYKIDEAKADMIVGSGIPTPVVAPVQTQIPANPPVAQPSPVPVSPVPPPALPKVA